MQENDPGEDAERVFDLIKEKKTKEVLQILKSMHVPLNYTDKTGMSLLDQASWSGLEDVVRFLLANGVDPNNSTHESGYKSLMFAAIAGHQGICQLLLDYGACVCSTNAIGKTAAEMAAFVGQHECVSIINNYIALDEIEKLLHPKGNDSDKIYSKEFSQTLHDLIKTHIIHPIWIMFFLRDHHQVIWQHRQKFCYVLDRIFEKQLRCKESNEVMSLKLWLILYTVRDTCKFVESVLGKEKYKASTIIRNYVKQLLKMEQTDRIRPNLERYMRNAVQSFPYHHCLLFQALIKNLGAIEFGNLPDAFSVIMSIFSGQRMVETSHFCATCGIVTSTKRCCRNIYYCHPDCQKIDWCNHKMFCEKIDKEKQCGEQGYSSRNNIVSEKIVQNDEIMSRSETIEDEQIENQILCPKICITKIQSYLQNCGTKMFLETIDPITGQQTWKVADEDYDLAQEIARSGFGDMIHDVERNKKYELGLKSIINQLKKKNEKVHVLDIGAGTGLLSMMAIRSGADSVTALEMLKPMANCAEEIVRKNGYEGQIRLIASRSTELTDEEINTVEKCDVIVAEVFDTELIGEGALRTFKEAHQKLAKPGCRVVPSSARVLLVPVQSDFLMRFHRLPSRNLKVPESSKLCPGAGAIHDIHLSEVPNEKICVLAEPFVAFSFDFEDGPSIKYNETLIKTFYAQSDGIFEAILMWWELDMDGTGQNILSTAPERWNKDAKWRDHWVQGVYYLPQSIQVRKNQSVSLHCSHDEFSFWFSASQHESCTSEPNYCRCKTHVACSRTAIYRLNELDEDVDFDHFLKENFTGKSVANLDDGSLMSLLLAKYAKTVRILKPNVHFVEVISAYIAENNIQNVHICEDYTSVPYNEVDVIVSEPFYLFSFLPWHNLCFWFTTHKLLTSFRNRNLSLSPREGIIYAMPVKFDDLWKIAAPFGIVEDFDLTPFDDVINKARSAVDAMVEPQPLWEYPSIITGEPITVARFDFNAPPTHASFMTKIAFSITGTNAIVFWMDWLHNGYRLTSGLLNSPEIGGRPNWSISQRQGVHFLPESERCLPFCSSVTVKVDFCPNAQFLFHFEYGNS
ncbi:Protein arginine N-methyltransferase [Dirofilaria immitis]